MARRSRWTSAREPGAPSCASRSHSAARARVGVVLGARADARDAQELEQLVADARVVGVEVGVEVVRTCGRSGRESGNGNRRPLERQRAATTRPSSTASAAATRRARRSPAYASARPCVATLRQRDDLGAERGERREPAAYADAEQQPRARRVPAGTSAITRPSTIEPATFIASVLHGNPRDASPSSSPTSTAPPIRRAAGGHERRSPTFSARTLTLLDGDRVDAPRQRLERSAAGPRTAAGALAATRR